jgi:hypothetical protein
MPEPISRQELRIERIVVSAVALLVIAMIAVRSTFGVSFYDDSHYVTVALRLAQGARPFADEMSVQSLGFLPATTFVWLWTHLFGLTGLVTAFRLAYIAAATAVGSLAYVQLRRSFHPLTAALAVAVPLMCPPFNLFAPGYNQMATLGLLLGTVLAHRAWLDRSRLAAGGAGLSLVFASVTYPPLTVAALVLIGILIVTTRDRRVIIPLLGTCAVASAMFIGGLLSFVSIADIRTGIAYATENVVGFHGPAEKLYSTLWRLTDSLLQPTLWPMWLAAAVACVPRIPRRVRAILLLALPLLALGRSIQALSMGLHVFGITAGAWLITFTLAAAIPVTVWAIAEKRHDLTMLLVFTLPVSAVGFLTVAYATDAPWLRGVAVIGMVPAAIGVIATWACALEELWGERLLVIASLIVLAIVVGMVWSESVDNGRPLAMSGYLDHGAYAGMHMSPERAQQILDLEAAARKWVKPGDRVTFYGERQSYLAVGGRIYTNAVWLYPAPSDIYALRYFAAHGGMPDVVFTDQFSMRLRHMMPYEFAAKSDPLIARLLAEYTLVDTVADYGVWVRR